jgi:DNA-binding NarL/FixJ family response regulator
VANTDGRADSQESAQDAAVSSTPIRIVIAEDHAFVQEGTRRLLEREPDIEVAGVAADGAVAVALTERLRPNLVLMDIAMPGMDGIAATRRIRASCPDIPVLILSAYDDDQYVFALVEAGAAGYLLKDVSGDQLVDAIRAVTRGESVLHPTIAGKIMRRIARADPPRTAEATDTLSARELAVLRLAARGLGNDAIALELQLSPRTVQAHLSHIFAKMRVSSRTQAVVEALRRDWIRLEELDP